MPDLALVMPGSTHASRALQLARGTGHECAGGVATRSFLSRWSACEQR
jgi:hypothetical protein